MSKKSYRFFKHIHLIISLVIVIPTAIIYGSPSILPKHLNIEVHTIDLANMLKAIMCFYLGASIVWILGIWKSKYWIIATQLNILFMITLAIGRVLSMFSDGLPTGGYIFGVIAEFSIALLSIYQFKRYQKEYN